MITVDDLDALVRAVEDAGDPLVLETLAAVLQLALDGDPGSAKRAELAGAIRESPAAADGIREVLAASIIAAGAEEAKRKRLRHQVERLERFVADCGNASVLLDGVADLACEAAADLRNLQALTLNVDEGEGGAA